MIETLEELRQVLSGTPLQGRRTVALPVRGGDPRVLAIEVQSHEVLDTWKIARDLISVTGRCPVAMSVWESTGNWAEALAQAELFDARQFETELGRADDVSPSGLIEASQTIDVDGMLARLEAEYDLPDEDDFEDDRPLGEDPAHMRWFEPRNQPVALMLMPSPRSWETLAYFSWFAAQTIGTLAVLAVARRWAQRYEAKLVAHWDTMLQYIVGRPPSTIEEARVLAREHTLIAPCTTLLPGVSLEAHAHALIDRDRWFLHERP